MNESIKLLSILEDDQLDGSRAEVMIGIAQSLGLKSNDLPMYLHELKADGFAQNPDDKFVWEITDAGRVELERLRQTPEGRKALGEDETW